MAQEDLDALHETRNRLVESRRRLAKDLAKPYERGTEERWARMISVQTTIDRAIADEEKSLPPA
jgi:hypothetical protein